MSETSELVEKALAMHLFREFSREEMESFVEIADRILVRDDESVVKQDTPGDAMFVIMSGSVKVTHRKGGTKIVLATLGPGEFFGETALIDHGPRSADVDAVGDCALLKVEGGTVRALSGVFPGAAYKFLVAIGRVLVERMRLANQKYIDSLLVGKQ